MKRPEYLHLFRNHSFAGSNSKGYSSGRTQVSSRAIPVPGETFHPHPASNNKTENTIFILLHTSRLIVWEDDQTAHNIHSTSALDPSFRHVILPCVVGNFSLAEIPFNTLFTRAATSVSPILRTAISQLARDAPFRFYVSQRSSHSRNRPTSPISTSDLEPTRPQPGELDPVRAIASKSANHPVAM